MSSKNDDDSDQNTICPKHNKKYEFLCVQCNKKLCADCLFEEFTASVKQHSNHKIDKVVDKKQEAIDKLKEEIEKAKALKENITKQVRSSPSTAEQLEKQKNEMFMALYSSFHDFQKNLDNLYTQDEKKLLEEASCIDTLVDKAEKAVDMASAIITTNDVGVFIGSADIVQKIEEFAKNPPPFVHEHQTFPETNFILPKEVKFDFDLPDFTEILASPPMERPYIYTPEFKAYGAKWRGKLYPQGNCNGSNTHISMFLEVLRGFDRPFKFNYQVSIIHPSKDVVLERHFVSEFQNLDSWGWNRLALLDTVTKEGFIFPDNKLRIQIKLSPTNYYVLTEIYLDILDRKQAKIQNLKKQLAEAGCSAVSKDQLNSDDSDLDWRKVELPKT